jgi:phage shock protein A
MTGEERNEMIDRSQQDVRSRLTDLKRRLVAAVADEQRLYQRHSEANREADRWRQRAELAAGRGADDLARAALERARRHASVSLQFHEQYLEQKGYVERLKGRLLETERRIRERPATVTRPIDTEKLERSLAHLERWEERLREERARLAAMAELERDEVEEKLAALEREAQLEQQLAELKRKLGRE